VALGYVGTDNVSARRQAAHIRSILPAPDSNPMHSLPEVDLKDILVCQSKPSRIARLCVSVYELPARAYAVEQTEGYCFAYRPWTGRGNTWATVPALNLADHRIGPDRCLMLPPRVPTRVEWINAAGRMAKLEFSPHFLETIADQVGLPKIVFEPPRAAFFSFDPHLEALCRLLMEETEADCSRGSLYFEALTCAVTVGLLGRMRAQAHTEPHVAAVPETIWRTVQWLEEHFANKVCIETLAAQAGLSPRHFARSFLQATGYTPHNYILRLRLSRARELIRQSGKAICLKELATLCGFYDQTHFGRHFRRRFGTTPAAFMRMKEDLSNSGHDAEDFSYGRNVPDFVRNVRNSVGDS
jgi:AraC family transcriptional regulator